MSIFREGYGSRIEDGDTALKRFERGDMGMPVCEDGLIRHWRQMLLIPQVSVGQEKPCIGGDNLGKIAHNGELQHHLIYFGVAVAAYCDDALFFAVEEFGHFYRVILTGDAIAWAVIEGVAEQNQSVRLESVCVFKRLLQCCRYAVNIGKEENFHQSLLRVRTPAAPRRMAFSSLPVGRGRWSRPWGRLGSCCV